MKTVLFFKVNFLSCLHSLASDSYTNWVHHLSETICYKVKSYFPVNYKMAEKTYDATLLLNPSEWGWGGGGEIKVLRGWGVGSENYTEKKIGGGW